MPIHQICHRTIHATFTEKELAQSYFTFPALLGHEAIRRFADWVKKKDPGFYDCTVTSNRKRR